METQETKTHQNPYDNEAFKEAVRKEVEKVLRMTLTASLLEKIATHMSGLEFISSDQVG